MRRADAIARADTILLAAKEVFLDRGYEAASMDEVALRAETTKRTVYNHFAGKEELFRAVVQFAVRLFVEKMPELDPAADVEEQLESFATRYCELATWRDSIRLQQAIFAERARFPDLAALVFRQTTQTALDRLSRFLVIQGSPQPDLDAEVFLNAATSPLRLRRLHGMGEMQMAPPGSDAAPDLDRRPILRAIEMLRAVLRPAAL